MESYKIKLQLPGVDELLHSPSDEETELALEELWNMLKKDRTDPLHLSDIIPHVLLELGEEQKCYDFIKWCALRGPKTPSSSLNTPFFDLTGADACEPLAKLRLSCLSLSHLVALTLIKLRLYMDLDAIAERHFDTSYGFGSDVSSIDRPLGEIAEEKFETTIDSSHLAELASNAKEAYLDLCRKVNEANSHLWEALAAEEPISDPAPGVRGPGSRDEADLVLYYCRRAWDKVEDALVMIEADTGHYIRAYTGPSTTNESEPLPKQQGTGRVFPTVINYVVNSASNNQDILASKSVDNSRGRLTLGKPSKLLLYTDGSCINNGQTDARGGWCVSLGASDPHLGSSFISGRLEEIGPFGNREKATSNRAELRAVIAALRMSDWKSEGFTSLVVATDSTYVLNGATKWAKAWIHNGWRLRDGKNVKNKDLWQLLLGEVERWHGDGVEICLLNIPRHLNQDADVSAKAAAASMPTKIEFTDITLGSPRTRSTKPRLEPYILAVCLAGVDYFEEFGLDPTIELPVLKKAYSSQYALECLCGPSPPSMIIISDATVTRHRQVLERIIDRVRDGATVVLSGTFANMATTGEISRIFTIFGLPWKRGNYQGSELKLSTGIVDENLTGNLPRKMHIKTSLVKGVEPSMSWYTDPDIAGEAAVAFVKVGSGRLGYIGYTDYSENAKIARAMFGLI
ncbi:hypothetical protein FSST1_001300 [Fusarium sambucinum]